MVLFIDACVRSQSRTRRLAEHLLSKRGEAFQTIRLEDIDFPKVDQAFLKRRDELISSQSFSDPMFSLARQFASSDEIVIASPFWDLSFPASLKQYFEQINVIGITFRYNEQGVPEGLCKAKRLTYVTTAGGDFFPEEYGFGYVRALAQGFYGIADVRLIKAVGLDMDGADEDLIIKEAKSSITE